jgi:hypothetical protein
MTTGYNVLLRNAQLDAITAAIGNAGTLKIYDGVRPATGGAVTNLLATFTLGTPFAPASAAGVLSPNLPANTTGTAAGNATWVRVSTSGGTQEIDGSVGTAGSDLNLNTIAISIGLALSVTSFSISRGNA